MYISKKSGTAFSLALMMYSLINPTNAEAGILRVSKQNADPILLQVIPEPISVEASYCWKCLTGPCNIPRKDVAEIVIPSNCIRGKERFAVIGTTGGILFNGKCRNLSVFKNYELTFLNDSIGTSCISREF